MARRRRPKYPAADGNSTCTVTQLNITGIISAQNHAQSYGIEHLAVVTDDYPATMTKLRENGVAVLEELKGDKGNRVAFVAGPDGSQMEIIEQI